MDPEYLFFFKNKHSFDLFKSSAYFQEDLYTLALAQHVQGLIPLRNRKIKELDRNHPACSGKNKFVFSLKTSAGEFFLSTQYSIQMDDWLDAFRELYRLYVICIICAMYTIILHPYPCTIYFVCINDQYTEKYKKNAKV